MVSAAAAAVQTAIKNCKSNSHKKQTADIYIQERESMKKNTCRYHTREREKLKQTPLPDHNTYTPFSLP